MGGWFFKASVLVGFAGASAGAFVPRSASALSETLRCESKLVSAGDSMFEVRSLCGVPDDRQQHMERRNVRRAQSVPCGAGTCVVMVDDTVEVSVEEWVYDFGPHRFLQFLRFEQGVLTYVKSGGYGKKDV